MAKRIFFFDNLSILKVRKFQIFISDLQGRFQSLGQGDANFYRGVPTIIPHIYKQRADIWLSYCYMYIIFSRIKLAFFTKTLPKHIHFSFYLNEQLSNRLSLNCLWFDLIPTFLVLCTMSVPWQFKIWPKLWNRPSFFWHINNNCEFTTYTHKFKRLLALKKQF